MIAYLKGKLAHKDRAHVIIDVNGVGYLINVTANTATKHSIGNEISLFTAMIVREDAMTLFGFNSALEQELFDLLRLS